MLDVGSCELTDEAQCYVTVFCAGRYISAACDIAKHDGMYQNIKKLDQFKLRPREGVKNASRM